jgi:hypothetical protein
VINSIKKKLLIFRDQQFFDEKRRLIRAAVSIFSSSLGYGLSRVHRRVIRRYFRSIGFLHPIRLVWLLYHTLPAIDEESLNRT